MKVTVYKITDKNERRLRGGYYIDFSAKDAAGKDITVGINQNGTRPPPKSTDKVYEFKNIFRNSDKQDSEVNVRARLNALMSDLANNPDNIQKIIAKAEATVLENELKVSTKEKPSKSEKINVESVMVEAPIAKEIRNAEKPLEHTAEIKNAEIPETQKAEAIDVPPPVAEFPDEETVLKALDEIEEDDVDKAIREANAIDPEGKDTLAALEEEFKEPVEKMENVETFGQSLGETIEGKLDAADVTTAKSAVPSPVLEADELLNTHRPPPRIVNPGLAVLPTTPSRLQQAPEEVKQQISAAVDSASARAAASGNTKIDFDTLLAKPEIVAALKTQGVNIVGKAGSFSAVSDDHPSINFDKGTMKTDMLPLDTPGLAEKMAAALVAMIKVTMAATAPKPPSDVKNIYLTPNKLNTPEEQAAFKALEAQVLKKVDEHIKTLSPEMQTQFKSQKRDMSPPVEATAAVDSAPPAPAAAATPPAPAQPNTMKTEATAEQRANLLARLTSGDEGVKNRALQEVFKGNNPCFNKIEFKSDESYNPYGPQNDKPKVFICATSPNADQQDQALTKAVMGALKKHLPDNPNTHNDQDYHTQKGTFPGVWLTKEAAKTVVDKVSTALAPATPRNS